jgi:hypothetical protein
MLFRRPWQRKRNSLGLCKLQMASRPEAKTSKVDRISARHPAGPGKRHSNQEHEFVVPLFPGEARRSASRWNLGTDPGRLQGLHDTGRPVQEDIFAFVPRHASFRFVRH